MPGLEYSLVAFHRAFSARERSRLTGRRGVTEGRKLALQAGQLKELPAVPILLVRCSRSFLVTYFCIVTMVDPRGLSTYFPLVLLVKRK